MKLLHISSALSWRGGEQQIASLLEELNVLGIDQQVYCPAGSPLAVHCKENQIAFQTYQKHSSFSLSTAKSLAGLAKNYKADLVHMHDSHAHTYAVLASSFFGLKCDLVLHRRVDFPIGKNWGSRWKYNHPSIKKIICVSDFIRELISPKIKKKAKVCTVHSGINLSRFQEFASGKLQELCGLPKATRMVGKVAAIAPHKDYFTFVEACKIIHQKEPSIHFAIMGGDGGEEQKIRDFIIEKGMQDCIHLTGFQKNIPELLPDLTTFLFTSKTEGLGTSLLDAAASGIPIVATRAGGIPEIIQDGHNGILADVKDAKELADGVLQLLNDDELSDEFRRNGKERVKAFSKKETARKTLAVYESIKS